MWTQMATVKAANWSGASWDSMSVTNAIRVGCPALDATRSCSLREKKYAFSINLGFIL